MAMSPKELELRDGSREWVDTTKWLAKFNTLMSKYSDIETLFSRHSPLCGHEIRLLDKRCVDFGFWFPKAFQRENLNPKFHSMICHMHDLAKDLGPLGISPGMTTEQAIESLHVLMNREQKNFKKGEKEAVLPGTFQGASKKVNPALSGPGTQPQKRRKVGAAPK